MLGLDKQHADLIILLNWHTSLKDCHRGTMMINEEVFEVVGPPGEICVTSGRFPVVLEWSPKFGRILPELKDIPDRTEIKFHGFNWGWEGEGCIGPGRTGGVNYVNDSWDAVEEIIAIMEKAASKDQSVWIEIIKSEDANVKNIFKEFSRVFFPQAVEDLLSGNGAKIVEAVISEKIKDTLSEHAGNALEVYKAAQDCEKEYRDFANAAMALSEKMKQNALATKATYDDKPFIWFDAIVDKIFGGVKKLTGV